MTKTAVTTRIHIAHPITPTLAGIVTPLGVGEHNLPTAQAQALIAAGVAVKVIGKPAPIKKIEGD